MAKVATLPASCSLSIKSPIENSSKMLHFYLLVDGQLWSYCIISQFRCCFKIFMVTWRIFEMGFPYWSDQKDELMVCYNVYAVWQYMFLPARFPINFCRVMLISTSKYKSDIPCDSSAQSEQIMIRLYSMHADGAFSCFIWRALS